MTTLNFRLPANRADGRAQRRPATSQRLPPCSSPIGPLVPIVKKMDAEAAALIALRRLGARELQMQNQPAPGSDEKIASSSWFDSTWELANGLDIAEGIPADLPLDGWLQFYLAA